MGLVARKENQSLPSVAVPSSSATPRHPPQRSFKRKVNAIMAGVRVFLATRKRQKAEDLLVNAYFVTKERAKKEGIL